VFIGRAMCGIEYKRRRLVFEEQSASFSNCDQQLCMKLDDHCLWRGPRSREMNSVPFVCISISLLVLNKLLYTWCGDYCKCVRPAQLPVLTEIRAPSLLEQYPWYVLTGTVQDTTLYPRRLWRGQCHGSIPTCCAGVHTSTTGWYAAMTLTTS
jgi:hypothetical protein